MAFCNNCGEPLNKGLAFCTVCGNKVKESNLAPVEQSRESVHNYSRANEKPASKNNWLKIVIISVFGVAVLFFAGYFILDMMKEEEKIIKTSSNNNEEKETNKESSSEDEDAGESDILADYERKLEKLEITGATTVDDWDIELLNGTLFLSAKNIQDDNLNEIFSMFDSGNLEPLRLWAIEVSVLAELLAKEVNADWSVQVGNDCTGMYPSTLSQSDLSAYSGSCGYSVPVLTGYDKDSLTLFINHKVYSFEKELGSTASGDFILSESGFRQISMQDISSLSPEELRIARNEIYARHGYIFESEDLQMYFSNKAWYYPDSFYDGTLSEIEKYNVDLIKMREEQLK